MQGNLSLVGIFEYLQLWDSLQEVVLSDNSDTHVGLIIFRELHFQICLESVLLWLHHRDSYGDLGHRQSVRYFCGWRFVTDAGLLIALP